MTDNILGGKVTYEDAVKHDGYPDPQYAPSRRAAVELSFDVPEGENGKDRLDLTFAVAVAKVNEMLGKKPVKEVATETTQVATPTKKTKTKAASEPAKEPAKTELSDKEKLAQAAGVLVTETAKVEPVQADIEDSLDDLLGDQAPVPITDAELAKAAQNKMGHMKAKDPNFGVKIRGLVVEYAGQPPKKITDVPVAKRQEFLDKLRDLT